VWRCGAVRLEPTARPASAVAAAAAIGIGALGVAIAAHDGLEHQKTAVPTVMIDHSTDPFPAPVAPTPHSQVIDHSRGHVSPSERLATQTADRHGGTVVRQQAFGSDIPSHTTMTEADPSHAHMDVAEE
jgi:hypothetical protein